MLSDFRDIRNLFDNKNNIIYTKIGMRDALLKKQAESKKRQEDLVLATDNHVIASIFLQTLSDTTRHKVLDRISSIVSDALQQIKDPNLEFKMNLTTERNQMDLKFVVVDKKTKHEYDILNSCGGSIADIVSFPLKFSLLMKWEPSLSRIMILDESFKFVSVIDQEPLGEFIRQVSEKLGLQVILVTHSPTLSAKAHRIFQVTKKGSESIIEERPS